MPRCPRRTGSGGLALGWRAVLACAVAFAPACADAVRTARTMRLSDFEPRNRSGVYLNEDVVFVFSSEIDPASVTAESVRVVDEDGRTARGRWIVEGRMVQFQPAPVLAPTLDDGGYRPDTVYVAQVVGFPRLDGVRSVRGEPLAEGASITFRTVAVTGPRTGFLFDDTSPATAESLRVASTRIGPYGPIVLHCDEPLDPSTLASDDFRLEGADEDVELEARLVSNHDVGAQPRGEPCAILELLPRTKLATGEYTLRFDAALRLRDFGGNPVWRPRSAVHGKVLEVVEEGRREGAGELHLAFLDDARFSPVAVPDTDGTAFWDGTGRVEVRYPAAAGTGADGALALKGPWERDDVHATRLRLVAGERCDLRGRGLLVLRSQGRFDIDGELVREGSRPAEMDFGLGETLSDWLARARQGDQDWTVLVAGGDLVVDGVVDVDTPLLLVAGGRIRIEGAVRARPEQLWLLRDGGGLHLDPTASVPDLVMDPPTRNPLREPLRFAALSSPLPPWGRVARWVGASDGGHPGHGRYRVRYVPGEGPLRRSAAVDHPRLLEGPICLLIELELLPGPPWDPPFVDFVQVEWDVEPNEARR